MPRPTPNLLGKTFGPATVIRLGTPVLNPSGSHSTTWVIRCVCGDEFIVRAGNLRTSRPGRRKCHCDRPPKTDWSGKRFGRLAVSAFLCRDRTRNSMWLCACDCGNITTVSLGHLMTNTNSCGCLQVEARANSSYRPTLPSGVSARNKILAKYQRWAKERNLGWLLTDTQFDILVARNCEYCGIPPSRTHTRGCNGSFTYNGIDRVDNGVGYTTENTVACCTMCNMMKRTYTKDSFLNHVARIYRHTTGEATSA